MIVYKCKKHKKVCDLYLGDEERELIPIEAYKLESRHKRAEAIIKAVSKGKEEIIVITYPHGKYVKQFGEHPKD